MKKYLYYGILFSIIPFAESCGDKKKINSTSNEEVIPVKVIEINKKGFSKEVEASGQITTDDETYLSFKTGGIIKKIYVSEGDKIVKGQLLAELDLTEINAALSRVQRVFEKSDRDLNRMRQLYRDSAVTLEALQNTETGYEIAKEQLREVQFNLKHSEIRALENGRVLKKLANEGQLVGVGIPIIQTNGAGTKQWRIKASVSDADWALVMENDEARIITDAEPNKIYKGKVIRKSASTDLYTGAFTADVVVFDQNIKAASGMFAKVRILTKMQTSGWQIPYEALIDANANKGYVFIAENEGIAKKKEVTIGEIKETGVTILNGLEESERVIVSGSAYLRDLSRIKIEK